MTVSIQTPEAVHSEKPETTSKEVAETTPKELSEHTYEFEVTMTCTGCSGAVTRVLSKLKGVKSYDVNLEKRLVFVTAEPDLDYDTVYEKIKKTGKHVKWGEADGGVRSDYDENGNKIEPKKKLPEEPVPGGADDGVKIESEKVPEQIAA